MVTTAFCLYKHIVFSTKHFQSFILTLCYILSPCVCPVVTEAIQIFFKLRLPRCDLPISLATLWSFFSERLIRTTSRPRFASWHAKTNTHPLKQRRNSMCLLYAGALEQGYLRRQWTETYRSRLCRWKENVDNTAQLYLSHFLWSNAKTHPCYAGNHHQSKQNKNKTRGTRI